MDKMSRREFLEKSGKTALGVGLASAFGGALSLRPAGAAQTKKVGANDKILVGCIGTGGMGIGNMHSFLDKPDVEVIAVCDVDSRHAEEAAKIVEQKKGNKPQIIHDFRKLLEINEINAVSIATPDHWHALPFIMAAEAGKDIYVEKPISHDITEARSMVAAAKKFGTVVQCGTWQRSVQHFVDANAYIASGKLGKIHLCRAWTCGGGGLGKKKAETPPKELDWDFWIGPAKYEDYRSNNNHFEFRWYYNFASGLTGDWGAHMLDTVLQGMRDWHPSEVASYGGKLVSGEDDDRTTPDTQIAIYKFADWILQWEVHVGDPGLDGGRGHGAEFIGDNAILRVDREDAKIISRSDGKMQDLPPAEKVTGDHVRNFLDCMRSRDLPRSDIYTMQYSNALCHLANMAYQHGASIKWDGPNQNIIGDKAAKRVQSFQRDYRKPWVLPRYDLKG